MTRHDGNLNGHLIDTLKILVAVVVGTVAALSWMNSQYVPQAKYKSEVPPLIEETKAIRSSLQRIEGRLDVIIPNRRRTIEESSAPVVRDERLVRGHDDKR